MFDPKENGERLFKAGIRQTLARTAIMECLMEKDGHPTTEELNAALKEKGVKIPLATLYQNLEKLASSGLITRFSSSDGMIRYDANLQHHHHLVCTSCHRIMDVGIDGLLSGIALREEKTGEPVNGWTLSDAEIELKGKCPGCSSTSR